MKLVICVQLAYVSVCLTQLSVVREWTSLDVQLPPEYGEEARRSVAPSVVKSWLLYKDRVFVTLYGSWEYSLAYLDLTDNSTSPLLRPHPSYKNLQMINLDKVRVDLSSIVSMILAPNSIVFYEVAGKSKVYYNMSTTHLRNKSKEMIDVMELSRSRKLNVNLYLSALDAKSDVLYYIDYYNRTVIHAIPCWTSERCSSNCHHVSIDPTHELRYITVDENGDLWAVTRRSSFEDGEIHLRLLSVPDRSTCVESNANDTTNTSTGVESNAKDTTNTSTDVEPNAKDTTNTANMHESTTAASSTTEQTSAVGGTNVPFLLFSFTNTTFNLSNYTINIFPNDHFH